jgi:hypothetical protein
MPPQDAQTFENHARYVPLYHGVLFGIVIVNLVWSVIRIIRRLSADTVVALLMALAFLLLFYYARRFALTVQDRMIRLEMRLRLAKVLPADLAQRIGELTVSQLIGLRFASDEELPKLVRKVLTEGIADRTAIKRMVRNWQGDYLRV